MADGITIPASGTGDATPKVATDDAGAAGHVQLTKLAISTDGSATAIPADAANGIDVDVTRLPGQYAEDSAHASGNLVIPAGVVQQTADAALSGDGDNSLMQVDANGYLKVNVKAGAAGGVTHVDDAAFTVGTDDVVPAAGTYRSTRDAVDNNDAGALAMTARRALLVAQDDSDVSTATWTSATGADTLLTMSVQNHSTVLVTFRRSGTITAGQINFEASADGTNYFAVRGSRLGSVANVALPDVVPAAEAFYLLNTAADRVWQVDVAGFKNFQVRLEAVIAGAGSALMTISSQAASVMDHTIVTVVDANGVAQSFAPDHTASNDPGAMRLSNGTDFTDIGKAEDAVHVTGDYGVPAWAVRSDTAASTAANGDYHPLEVDSTGRLHVTASNVAHDAADSGNPVKVGAKCETSLEGVTLVADGDRTDLYADADGVLMTKGPAPFGDIISERVTNTDGASTAFSSFDAGGSGVRNYVSNITICNTSASACTVDLRNGTAGAVLWTFPVPAGGGVTHNFGNVPLRQTTANTALAFDASAATSTLTISLNGFQSKV